MVKCQSAPRADTCFFTSDGLAWSTTGGSVSSLQDGGSVNLNPFTHHPPGFGYSYLIFNNCGMISDPYRLVGASILFSVVISEPMLAIWSEGLAKCPHRKNTARTVRLAPAIYRLQIPAPLLPHCLNFPSYEGSWVLIYCWANREREFLKYPEYKLCFIPRIFSISRELLNPWAAASPATARMREIMVVWRCVTDLGETVADIQQ